MPPGKKINIEIKKKIRKIKDEENIPINVLAERFGLHVNTIIRICKEK